MNPFQRRERAISLVELMVASAFFVLLFFVAVKMFKTIVQTSTQTRQRLDASTCAKEISEVLKTIPFDDLYSMDSDMKHPPTDLLPGIPNYYTPNYLFTGLTVIYYQDWDLNLSSPTFYGIERDVLNRGFSRFSVEVTHIVRPIIAQYRGVAPPRPWNPRMHFTQYNNCDREVTNLCFNDLDGDGRYWSRGETPQTNAKELVVKVYDNRGRVAQTETFFHTSSGLSSREIYSTKDPLMLRVPFGSSMRLTRGSSDIQKHLEYKSVFGLGYNDVRYEYLSDNDKGRTGDSAMVVNQSRLHEAEPDAPVSWKSGGDLGSLVLHVETPLTGEIQVFPYINGCGYPFNYDVKAFPDMTPFVTIPLGRQAHAPRDGLFLLDKTNDWKLVQDAFHNDPWLQNNDTFGYIILRKVIRDKSSVVVSSSSLFYSWVDWDVHPPIVSTAPVPSVYNVGLNPLLQVGVKEPNGGWMRDYNSCQFMDQRFSSFIIEKDNGFGFVEIATAMWSKDGATEPYSVSYPNRAKIDATRTSPLYAEMSLRLVDKDELPAVLPDYGTYRITCEFADAHLLKSSYTWVSTFKDGGGALSDFKVDLSTFVGPWGTFVANENNDASHRTVVPSGTSVNLGAIQLSGTGWGIKWETVKVKDCKDDLSDCTDVLGYSGPKPGNFQYGLYFDFGTPDNPNTRFSDKATYSFTKSGNRALVIFLETWKAPAVEINHIAWYLTVM